jgi:hypothetical protein
MCEFLVDNGMDMNMRTAQGWYTPLHLALGNGYMDTAQFFLLRGANPWLKNKYGEDPYKYGEKKGYRDKCRELKLQIIKIEMQKSIERMNINEELGFASPKKKKGTSAPPTAASGSILIDPESDVLLRSRLNEEDESDDHSSQA